MVLICTSFPYEGRRGLLWKGEQKWKIISLSRCGFGMIVQYYREKGQCIWCCMECVCFKDFNLITVFALLCLASDSFFFSSLFDQPLRRSSHKVLRMLVFIGIELHLETGKGKPVYRLPRSLMSPLSLGVWGLLNTQTDLNSYRRNM